MDSKVQKDIHGMNSNLYRMASFWDLHSSWHSSWDLYEKFILLVLCRYYVSVQIVLMKWVNISVPYMPTYLMDPAYDRDLLIL